MRQTKRRDSSNKKVSNNVLIVLILTAIGFSVLSTWASLSYLGIFTGAASTGTVSVTPATTASCRTDAGDGDSTVSFGSQARGAVVRSSNTTVNDWFITENDGNVNITVQIYTAGGTDNLWDLGSYAAPSLYWQANCNNTQSGSGCTSTYNNINASQGTAFTIVTNLGSADTVDYVVTGINITVPLDEPAGAKSGIVTFYCTET